MKLFKDRLNDMERNLCETSTPFHLIERECGAELHLIKLV